MQFITGILKTFAILQLTMVASCIRLTTGNATDHRERGDVPGWVMITLMSAVLVAGLLAIAAPALEGLFSDAIQRVAP